MGNRRFMASDFQIGDKVNNRSRGDGLVIGKTKRTVKVQFEFSTVTWTFVKDTTGAELGIFKMVESESEVSND